MNVKTKSDSKKRGSKYVTFASGLVLGCGLATGGATHASGVPVIDIPHTIFTQLGWGMDYAEQIDQLAKLKEQYDKLKEQYDAQLEQMRQLQIGASGGYSGKPGKKAELPAKRSRYQDEDKACPEFEKAPVPGQRAVCKNIVRFQNDQYNQLVDVLELEQKRTEELEKIYAEREGIKSDEPGRLQDNSNKIMSIQARAQLDMQNAKTTLDAYQSVVVSLEQEQARSTQMALEGRKDGSLVAGLVRGASLGLALEGARARDR
ncbi:MAG: hypothetical protein EOO81_02525 [Oxalobacteraceae bacterium]|nr:MAG: hypothetical protein EOO81_02525 [Oxalobacteraceae bacterium]